MKKIIVNEEACIGCGACVAIDEAHFAFNDEGLSHAISNENLESEQLLSAIESCLTSAISLSETEEEVQSECGTDECVCETCECSEDTQGCHCNQKKEDME